MPCISSVCFCLVSVAEESVSKIERIWGIWWPQTKFPGKTCNIFTLDTIWLTELLYFEILS